MPGRVSKKLVLAVGLGSFLVLPAGPAVGAPVAGARVAHRQVAAPPVARLAGPVIHVSSSSSPTKATIFLLQAMPEAVQVWVDGINAGDYAARTTTGFSYSQSPAPPGVIRAAIYPAGDGPGQAAALASTTTTLTAGSDYTLISYVDGTGQDQLDFLPFGTRPPSAGQARIEIRNTADSSPVDIYANGTMVVSDLADNPSDQQTAEVSMPTGSVKLTVTGAGNPSDVLASATIPFDAAEVSDLDVTGTNAGGVTGGTIELQGFGLVLPTGYWEASRTGAVYAEGTVRLYGSRAGTALAAPIVGIVASPDGLGYWLVSSGGGVFGFGDATYHGSLPAENVRVHDIVGMAVTPDGGGYWLVSSTGGVFSFGDARYYGSLLGGERLAAPIVGMAANDYDGGYWLVSANGGVFSFGNAGFDGSLAGARLGAPIVGMVPIADGIGYWLYSANGAVFNCGLAYYLGSAAGHTSAKVVGMTLSDDNQGLRLVTANGGIFDFGTATYGGVPSGVGSSIVGIAAP